MKYLVKIYIIAFSILISGCSHKQQATDIHQKKEASPSSLATYSNIYNAYGKLETISKYEKSFFLAGSSSSQEIHMSYKNDTILLKEEEYDILPDGSKELISICLFEKNIEKYIRFNNKDTVMQVNYIYENGQITCKRKIDLREYSKENSEIKYSYDSINRISEIKTIDYDNKTTTIEIYKYDIVDDTLITYIYVDNILKSTEKRIEYENYSVEFFFNNRNLLERSIKNIRIDSLNKVSVTIDNVLSQIDSSYYYSDKIVKTIIIPFEKERNNIDIDELDKNKGYSLKELIDVYAGPDFIRTVLYKYDEFGNITEEAWYDGLLINETPNE